MIRQCRFCNTEFEATVYNKLCCTTRCANLFRYRDPARSKPAMVYRGANYRNFLMSLRTKISERRDISIDYLCKLYEDQSGKCAISGRELTFITGQGYISTNISIDRIDSSTGYDEGNIQLVCRHVNIMKQQLIQDDLVNWCNDIVEYDKRKKK